MPARQSPVRAFVEVSVPTVLFGEDAEARFITPLLHEDLRVLWCGQEVASVGDVIPFPLDVESKISKSTSSVGQGYSGFSLHERSAHSVCVNSGYRRFRRGGGAIRLAPSDSAGLVPGSCQDSGMVTGCIAVAVRLEHGTVSLDRLRIPRRGQDE